MRIINRIINTVPINLPIKRFATYDVLYRCDYDNTRIWVQPIQLTVSTTPLSGWFTIEYGLCETDDDGEWSDESLEWWDKYMTEYLLEAYPHKCICFVRRKWVENQPTINVGPVLFKKMKDHLERRTRLNFPEGRYMDIIAIERTGFSKKEADRTNPRAQRDIRECIAPPPIKRRRLEPTSTPKGSQLDIARCLGDLIVSFL